MESALEWNDLNLILAIGRAGSLSGAARLLDLNHSTVFRRLNNVEKQLGVRFFERLPTGYVMTEAGETAVSTAQRISEQVDDLSRELVGKDLRLQGNIRVTGPEGLSVQLLSPALSKFSLLHPDINIDLMVTGSSLQLSRREADLAVRVTNTPPDNSIGRRICRFAFAMYASRKYLQHHQKQEPSEFDWLLTDDSRDWFPESVWKKLAHARPRSRLSSNSTLAILNACRAGLGVAPLPCFMGDSDKKLVRVVEPCEEMQLELWLLTHPDLRNTARVRVLMAFLLDTLSQKANLLEGTSPL